jgi:prevent-host-death family protein
MTYSIESAKAQFAQLLKKAADGEEVLITEKDKPVAKLVPIPELRPLKDLPQIMRDLEHHLTKSEADDFAHDIEEARKSLNATSIRNPWES